MKPNQQELASFILRLQLIQTEVIQYFYEKHIFPFAKKTEYYEFN